MFHISFLGSLKGKEVENIAKALVQAQRDFAPAIKNKTGARNARYADLSACIDAVIDALNNNGIMLMQQSHESDTGVVVETIFIHESGEQFSAGKLHIPANQHDAQAYGSALTYARRYSLMAACGLAPEDDDGLAASKTKTKVDDAYAMYVQATLETMEAAAQKGEEALKQAFLDLPKSKHKTKFWESHKESLKATAEKAAA